MPRQHQLPHTASPAGPCDTQRDAYVDAMEAASEAAAAKKHALQSLLDAMLEHSVDRVAVTDPKGRRKWLEITANPKLRSVKAEAGDGGGETEPRGSRRGGHTHTVVTDVRSTEHEDRDPFAATREQMAGEAENAPTLPAESTDAAGATSPGPIEPGAAGELVDGISDLRMAGQQRRRRGGR